MKITDKYVWLNKDYRKKCHVAIIACCVVMFLMLVSSILVGVFAYDNIQIRIACASVFSGAIFGLIGRVYTLQECDMNEKKKLEVKNGA